MTEANAAANNDVNKGGDNKGAEIDYDKLAAAIVKAQAGSGEKKPEDKKESVDESAKKKLAENDADAQKTAQIEGAVKFNKEMPEFLEKHDALFGTKDYVVALKGEIEKRASKDATEVAKAATRAESLLDIFVSRKENIDMLPAATKAKVDRWNAMADSAKHKVALEYFQEIVEVARDIRVASSKDKALAIKNGLEGINSDSLDKKMWEQAKATAPVFK